MSSKYIRSWCVRAHVISCVQLFAAPQTVALQTPLSMDFFKQEHWSGLPLLTPGDIPDPGMEPTSPVPPAFASRFFTASATWEASYASLCWAVTSRVRLFDHTDCSSPGSSVHGDSPGKNTGVGCHASSRGSSQHRDWTQVSCNASGFFTSWTTRETQEYWTR